MAYVTTRGNMGLGCLAYLTLFGHPSMTLGFLEGNLELAHHPAKCIAYSILHS